MPASLHQPTDVLAADVDLTDLQGSKYSMEGATPDTAAADDRPSAAPDRTTGLEPAEHGPHFDLVEARTGITAALEQLDAALGPQFSTILIRQPGRLPRLAVVDKQSRAATEVYADGSGQMWWPWAAPTAVTNDPQAAAEQVMATLRPGWRGEESGFLP